LALEPSFPPGDGKERETGVTISNDDRFIRCFAAAQSCERMRLAPAADLIINQRNREKTHQIVLAREEAINRTWTQAGIMNAVSARF
jgi:hypothetical protein